MFEKKPNEQYSLITGASSGIGKSIAYECAMRSMNLVLVALDDETLYETTLELRNEFPAIKIIALPVDLTGERVAHYIYEYCSMHMITVDKLINNAAIGGSGKFTSHSSAFHESALKINLVTPLILTRLFIPDMLKLEKAYILNVSSAAAFYDMPYKIMYASTKTFIFSFTRALSEELLNSGISVSVLCPGGVVTNEETRKRCEELGYLSRKFQLSSKLVAAEAIKGLLNGKKQILPGFSSKFFFILSKILPYSFKLYFLRKFYGRVYDLAPGPTEAATQIPVSLTAK